MGDGGIGWCYAANPDGLRARARPSLDAFAQALFQEAKHVVDT